jgi:hypothetical protein
MDIPDYETLEDCILAKGQDIIRISLLRQKGCGSGRPDFCGVRHDRISGDKVVHFAIEPFARQVKGEQNFRDLRTSYIQKGWKDVDDGAYDGPVEVYRHGKEVFHIAKDKDDLPVLRCVNNKGLDNFDKGVEYLFRGFGDSGFVKMEDKFGAVVDCLIERFETVLLSS